MVLLGRLKLKNPYLFAPIDMYSDSAFRSLCGYYGASYSFTQLIHTAGFIRKPGSLKVDLQAGGGIQFISNSPAELKEALRIVNEKEFYSGLANVRSVDLNLGCPSRKMAGLNLGSALLGKPGIVRALFRVMRRHSLLPVSAKMRLAVDSGHKLSKPFLRIAKIAEEEGLDFITVHGRCASQMYSGAVDVGAIKEVAQSVSIPVVGNGDVVDEESADNMLESCKAVMIGRHALREPFIFRRLNNRKWRFDYEKEKIKCISKYLVYAGRYHAGFASVKLHLQLLLKGVDKKKTALIASAEDMDDVKKILDFF